MESNFKTLRKQKIRIIKQSIEGLITESDTSKFIFKLVLSLID